MFIMVLYLQIYTIKIALFDSTRGDRRMMLTTCRSANFGLSRNYSSIRVKRPTHIWSNIAIYLYPLKLHKVWNLTTSVERQKIIN